jgi:hypothetical protein
VTRVMEEYVVSVSVVSLTTEMVKGRPGNEETLERVVLMFPRKEVIQPHLPVRLPCYDFTPITDPTLDACPPEGLAQRLQVLPTFVV